MIAKINIELNLSQKETLTLLKSNTVILRQKLPFIGAIEHTAVWSKLDNPSNFRFKLNSFGFVHPWWGKCSIYSFEEKGKSLLSILILPPTFFQIFGGFVLLGIVYTIIQFGIHNYGTPGFLPSIIIPSFLIALMILIWGLMAKHNATKIKKDIVASIKSQQESKET